MADIHLETPLLAVILDDGRELTIRILNGDYIRWDRTAAKHGWGDPKAVPFTWLTFVAWAGLRREGRIPQDWTWEEFSETRCLEVRAIPAEERNGLVGVDPTLPGPGPG